MPPSDIESSSGYIMSVIRVLTNSKDDAERDVIKKKLEDFLVVSDQKLTKLVSDHHKELGLVMKAFTSISNNLESSLAKLGRTKQCLNDSHEMLKSRLDELARLSDEWMNNKKILALLDRIDDLTRVPAQITELLDESRYLDATKLLVEKQRVIDESFESFDCLDDTRAKLDTKREEIYRCLREKLFHVEDGSAKEEIVKCLKLIDIAHEMPDLEAVIEKPETTQANRPSLFRFALSSHAMCFNEHYKEQNEVAKTLLSK